MTIEALEPLIRPLSVAGLVIGATGYNLLIRRRRRERVDAEERWRAQSASRARARFRRLRRNDDS